MKNELFRIGVITSTHGLRGEVKVFPTTQDPGRFLELKEILVQTGKELIPVRLRSVRFFQKYVIVSFEGMDRIEDVQAFLKKELYVTRENAVPLEEDEYYIADLIGLKVSEEDGTSLGTLTDVLQTGANDVYVIDTGDGELLLPAIHSCILKIDLEEGSMTVCVPEGLR